MEAFPDLASLSDSELKDLITRLETEENEISYQRRLLHGKLDILRAELVARLQQKGEGELGQVDLDRLTEILAGKTAPPNRSLSHIYCPECGFQNLESAHYCSRCGALLVTEGEPDETTQTFSAEEMHDERSDLLEELGIDGPALVDPLGRRPHRRARSRSSARRRRSGGRPTATSSSTTSRSPAGTRSSAAATRASRSRISAA